MATERAFQRRYGLVLFVKKGWRVAEDLGAAAWLPHRRRPYHAPSPTGVGALPPAHHTCTSPRRTSGHRTRPNVGSDRPATSASRGQGSCCSPIASTRLPRPPHLQRENKQESQWVRVWRRPGFPQLQPQPQPQPQPKRTRLQTHARIPRVESKTSRVPLRRHAAVLRTCVHAHPSTHRPSPSRRAPSSPTTLGTCCAATRPGGRRASALPGQTASDLLACVAVGGDGGSRRRGFGCRD